MQKQFEDQYHAVEADHWWFVGRREVVRHLVLARKPDRKSRILEMGCSAGLLMARLQRDGYGHVAGIDISPDGIERCRRAGLDAQVMDAQHLSFADASFDLITASDILEHLEDEPGALAEWRRVLKPGGLLVVFVPAFMFLWSEHDVANKHWRRYRRRQLSAALEEAGFKTERSSYWNALLFPPVAVVRWAKRVWRGGAVSSDGGTGDLFVPPRLLNAILLMTLRIENRLFRLGVDWPCGVSAMALARKPAD